MFQKSLYTKTEQVLIKLSEISLVKDFYLAGGTALALQLGHRKSQDLDFFTSKMPNIDSLKQALKHLNIIIVMENYNTLDLLIDEVKVSFLEYKYPLLKELVNYNQMNLASIDDIACMKLTAISSRGSKKDFIDLYAIVNSGIHLDQIFELFKKKYIDVDYSNKHILRSLVSFNEADLDPEVDYLDIKYEWEDVKKFFGKNISRYL